MHSFYELNNIDLGSLMANFLNRLIPPPPPVLFHQCIAIFWLRRHINGISTFRKRKKWIYKVYKVQEWQGKV
jgi:hypothetical protein